MTEEEKATAFVEQLTGGRVVKMKRLSRWRPAWFVYVQHDDMPLQKLHLRGDRRSDVLPFPRCNAKPIFCVCLRLGAFQFHTST